MRFQFPEAMIRSEYTVLGGFSSRQPFERRLDIPTQEQVPGQCHRVF